MEPLAGPAEHVITGDTVMSHSSRFYSLSSMILALALAALAADESKSQPKEKRRSIPPTPAKTF